MTDTNHIEQRARELLGDVIGYDLRRSLDTDSMTVTIDDALVAISAALSARASAGEGGEAFDTGPFIESLVDDGMIDLAIEAYNANYEGGQRAWMKAALISALKGINND